MTKHYKELDSLRGLAALIVIFTHFLGCLPCGAQVWANPPMENQSWWVWPLRNTPLGIIVEGNESVIFFFILSGFVLSLSFLNAKSNSTFLSYLVKRVFRLYPVFLVSLAAMALFKVYVNHHADIPEFSKFFNSIWRNDVNWKLFLNHLPLVTEFKHARILPPVWSLVVEMRISIIFPLLVWLFLKFRGKVLFVAVVLSIYCGFEAAALKAAKVSTLMRPIMETLQYVGCFMAGIYLAYTKNFWVPKVSALGRSSKYGILLVAILLYTNDIWFARTRLAGSGFPWVYNPCFTNYITTAGVCVLIILALTTNTASRFLNYPAVHFMGRISYSLYLWHMVLVCALAGMLHAFLPAWVILLITLGASIGVSALSYEYIELPFIRMGRSVADAVLRRQGVSRHRSVEVPVTTPE